jgi:hypothetical protein
VRLATIARLPRWGRFVPQPVHPATPALTIIKAAPQRGKLHAGRPILPLRGVPSYSAFVHSFLAWIA